ncbi:MAG: CPBP family intramembrane glutamic endopeptidase [archaeon]
MALIYSLGSILGEILTVRILGVKIAAGMVEWGLMLGGLAFIINVLLAAMSYNSMGSKTYNFLNSVFIIPVLEEIICRLLLISVFTIVFDSVIIAVFVSALLFALGHLLYGGLNFIHSFIDGLVWGWAFLTLGISVPIIAHIFHNFLVSVTNGGA